MNASRNYFDSRKSLITLMSYKEVKEALISLKRVRCEETHLGYFNCFSQELNPLYNSPSQTVIEKEWNKLGVKDSKASANAHRAHDQKNLISETSK